MQESTTTPVALGFVREDHMVELAKRVARINKQAAKVGAQPVNIVNTGNDEVRVTRRNENALGEATVIKHNFLEIAVYGEMPKLPGGWKLAAVIDHREKVAIVNGVPGMELPSGERERGAICDHCNTVRRRAETFVLVSESGEYTQVGRQCLADFLGLASVNPERVLDFWVSVGELLAFEGDDEARGLRASGAAWLIDVAEIAKISGAIINLHGFLSRAAAEARDQPATSGHVLDFIDPPQFSGRNASEERATFRAWAEKVRGEMTDDLDREVELALAWASVEAAKPNASEFLLNLAAFVECGTVSRKYLGSVVWILAGYRKAQDRLRETEAKAKVFANSAHFGTIGKRMEATLTLTDVRLIDGDYGTSYISTFSDADGNKVKWFASRDPRDEEYGPFQGGWEAGQERAVKMTVKGHGEWQGTPETKVNRVAEVTS